MCGVNARREEQMQSTDSDVMDFQACCGLDGRVCQIEIVKRNGRVAPLISRSFTAYSPRSNQDESEERARKLFRQLSCNLTKVERRTWRKLLVDGLPIAQVAAEEGVSRNAIYERIRGNSKGQGGMIAKNEFVALWWLRRKAEEDGLY
jgi:hypothetical protein